MITSDLFIDPFTDPRELGSSGSFWGALFVILGIFFENVRIFIIIIPATSQTRIYIYIYPCLGCRRYNYDKYTNVFKKNT